MKALTKTHCLAQSSKAAHPITAAPQRRLTVNERGYAMRLLPSDLVAKRGLAFARHAKAAKTKSPPAIFNMNSLTIRLATAK